MGMSREDGFIFIGPGRCGTTSIEKTLRKLTNGRYRTFPDLFCEHAKRKTVAEYTAESFSWAANHSAADDILTIFGLNRSDWRLAGAVRNPIKRIESLYSHTCRMLGLTTSQEHFEGWLRGTFLNPKSKLYRAHGRLRNHFEDQNSAILVDLVFSIEHAAMALEYMLPGLPPESYRVEHLNQSEGAGYIDRIDDTLRARLEATTAEDMAFWREIEANGGYKFYR